MKVAEAVSETLHPVLVILLSSIAAIHLLDPSLNPLKWIGHSIGFILTPLVIYYLYGLRKHGFEQKNQRKQIYFLGISLTVLYTLYIFYTGAPSLVANMNLSVLLSGALFAAVNLRTKISVHTGTLSGAASAIFGLNPVMGSLMFILVPVLGWSRIELERHTPLQVVQGALIPPLVFGAVFYLGSS